jgi:hypothetical protein
MKPSDAVMVTLMGVLFVYMLRDVPAKSWALTAALGMVLGLVWLAWRRIRRWHNERDVRRFERRQRKDQP